MDLADANVRALRYLRQGGKITALHLGTGFGSSVREVITAVENYSGTKVRFTESPKSAGDPPVLVANPARARVYWA